MNDKFDKIQELPGALSPHQGFAWTHWGPYGGPETPCRSLRTLHFQPGYAPDM